MFRDQPHLNLRALGFQPSVSCSSSNMVILCSQSKLIHRSKNQISPIRKLNLAGGGQARENMTKGKNRKVVMMTWDFLLSFVFLYVLSFLFFFLLLSLFVHHSVFCGRLLLVIFTLLFPFIILTVLFWPLVSILCDFYDYFASLNSLWIRIIKQIVSNWGEKKEYIKTSYWSPKWEHVDLL